MTDSNPSNAYWSTSAHVVLDEEGERRWLVLGGEHVGQHGHVTNVPDLVGFLEDDLILVEFVDRRQVFVPNLDQVRNQVAIDQNLRVELGISDVNT